MTDDVTMDGWVELPDAIAALRRDLADAWVDGGQSIVRFKFEPVELTIQVGAKRAGKGSAGVKWHVLALGGERSREGSVTQTLKLRMTPVIHDQNGQRLSDDGQLISGVDDAFAGRLDK